MILIPKKITALIMMLMLIDVALILVFIHVHEETMHLARTEDRKRKDLKNEDKFATTWTKFWAHNFFFFR